ncbi:MAG: hypothetical protein LKI57_09620 [Acetobacter lovaniensis]|nr:hypothetical protein [Acetobacter lovaniensis]
MPRYQITLKNHSAGRYRGVLADLESRSQIDFPDCSKHRQDGRSVITGRSGADLPGWFLEMSFVGDGVFKITLSDAHFRIEFPECELDETDNDEPRIVGRTDNAQALREKSEVNAA